MSKRVGIKNRLAFAQKLVLLKRIAPIKTGFLCNLLIAHFLQETIFIVNKNDKEKIQYIEN